MSDLCNKLHFADPGALGARWAAELLGAYPGRHAVKAIARDFRVSPRTAAGWLGGQVPQVAALARAWLLHGPALAARVLAPGSSPGAAGDPRLHRLRAGLDRLHADLLLLEGEAG